MPGGNESAKVMAATGAKNAKRSVGRWLIEGEYVTYEQIGARLGITATAARDRHRAARRKPGAMTWERLRK